MNAELFLTIFRVLILLTSLIFATRSYMGSKYKTQLYLNFAVLSYLLLEIFYFILLITTVNLSDTYVGIEHTSFYLSSVSTLTATNIAYSLLYLFFYSMENENVITSRLVVAGAIVLIVNSLLLSSEVILAFSLINVENYTYFNFANPSFNEWVVAILSLSNGVISLIIIIKIYSKINKRLREATRHSIIKNLKFMKYSFSILIVFGIFSFFSFSDYTFTIATMGFTGFIFYYLRGDILLQSKRSFRYLFIVNQSGLPVYQYNFVEKLEHDSLYTSALNAINSIFSEITGVDQQLKEVKMSDTNILVEFLTPEYSILLILDTITTSIKHAFYSFILSIVEKIPVGSPHIQFDLDKTLEIDENISYFFLN